MKKRVLFVAFPDSIHAARWIRQLSDNREWDVHLFPAQPPNGFIHPHYHNLTLHRLFRYRRYPIENKIKVRWRIPLVNGANVLEWAIYRYLPQLYIQALVRTVRVLKPDIIHSLEFQHAGYLSMAAKKMLKKFPPWVVTSWGSDVYLFGRLADHKEKVKEILSNCDYFWSECKRDVQLARDFGFNGIALDIIPGCGGYDLEHANSQRMPGTCAERNVVALKGYQHWAGRALFGLKAIENCADELHKYQIIIYSANEDVKIAAELLSNRSGLQIQVMPHTQHDEILNLHGRARISIGLSISDGLPVSLSEALLMGSFPIQSRTSCADEWIVDGENGLLVDAEDVDSISNAIRRALQDDALVNNAAATNKKIAEARLDDIKIRPLVLECYDRILSNSRKI